MFNISTLYQDRGNLDSTYPPILNIKKRTKYITMVFKTLYIRQWKSNNWEIGSKQGEFSDFPVYPLEGTSTTQDKKRTPDKYHGLRIHAGESGKVKVSRVCNVEKQRGETWTKQELQRSERVPHYLSAEY